MSQPPTRVPVKDGAAATEGRKSYSAPSTTVSSSLILFTARGHEGGATQWHWTTTDSRGPMEKTTRRKEELNEIRKGRKEDTKKHDRE